MVSVKRNSKLLTKILGVLVVAVWGEIAFQFLVKKKEPNTIGLSAAAMIAAKPGSPFKKFVFRNDIRDPFAYFHPAIHARKKKFVPLIVHVWTPPPVSLEGIMIGRGKKTAILSDRKGRIYFMSRGDTLDGLRVIGVRKNEVAYSYQKKDSSWTVRR